MSQSTTGLAAGGSGVGELDLLLVLAVGFLIGGGYALWFALRGTANPRVTTLRRPERPSTARQARPVGVGRAARPGSAAGPARTGRRAGPGRAGAGRGGAGRLTRPVTGQPIWHEPPRQPRDDGAGDLERGGGDLERGGGYLERGGGRPDRRPDHAWTDLDVDGDRWGPQARPWPADAVLRRLRRPAPGRGA